MPIQNDQSHLVNTVVTPVKPDRLYYYLRGYSDFHRNLLVSGFKFGFKIHNLVFHHVDGDLNSKSACIAPEIVDQKISKECNAGRVMGPLLSSPFEKFVISPLGLRAKKQPGEYRVIHNLSHPFGKSVNDGIPTEFSTVQYATVSDAISHILSFGKNCFMAKTDIKSAYRIVPIHPSDQKLLGFKWRGNYYFDKCLPMGCSSSCKIFETFSTALEWIISQKLTNVKVIHVLDNFLFIAPTFQLCQSALDLFIQIYADIGVPLAPDKTEGPSNVISFLGIELDTINMLASLPQDKVDKFLVIIHEFLTARSATLKKIQSLCGMLNFACSIILPARAFTRSLYNLQIGLKQHYYRAKITKSVKQDLSVWKEFLIGYNHKTFFLDFKWQSTESLCLYSDSASTIGFGAVFQNQWLFGLWHESCLRRNIALLELYPIVLAFHIWGKQFANRCLIIRTDNQAVMHILNSFTSKDRDIMILVRKLVLILMQYNILIKSIHLSGKLNILCDLISRNQVQKALELYPNLNKEPVSIPQHMLLEQWLQD